MSKPLIRQETIDEILAVEAERDNRPEPGYDKSLEAAVTEIEAIAEFDREQGGFPWELKNQEPNIRAANEHLHKRIAELEDRIYGLELANRLLAAQLNEAKKIIKENGVTA
ncbi:hypothetical protein [Jiangella anatolica]|uniref:Uncharacterized protein n=1 Tax=Jiangella anatolica TaxID=2670374 RepID=A0A2W2BA94_9ACTN|nr:hypothetical protein [Jiangella anatolica]PZF84175.1 hypothetical protein C1I92_10010 [Jiangella anatolica]